MTTKVEVARGQDFIIHEEDYRYTRIEGSVTPAADVDLEGGLALTGAAPNFIPHTNDAGTTTVTGLLVGNQPGAVGGTVYKLAVMVQGPAVVDKGSLFDVAGAALDAGGLVDVADLKIKAVDPADLIEEGNPAI